MTSLFTKLMPDFASSQGFLQYISGCYALFFCWKICQTVFTVSGIIFRSFTAFVAQFWGGCVSECPSLNIPSHPHDDYQDQLVQGPCPGTWPQAANRLSPQVQSLDVKQPIPTLFYPPTSSADCYVVCPSIYSQCQSLSASPVMLPGGQEDQATPQSTHGQVPLSPDPVLRGSGQALEHTTCVLACPFVAYITTLSTPLRVWKGGCQPGLW